MKKAIVNAFMASFIIVFSGAVFGGIAGISVYRLALKQNEAVDDTPAKCAPKDCCKKIGASNDARPLVDESCRAMRAGLRYIEEGLPQDRAMRADAREKLATAIVRAEVWLEATK